MTGADRDAALGAMMRRMRTERDLPRQLTAGSLLMLRGPLREIDDRLCGMDLAQLQRLPHGEPGAASVN